jgi:uncharacterized heparinase superfamily protein
MARRNSGFGEERKGGLGARATALRNALAARAAARSRPPTGFTSQPEPRTLGAHARGRQLLSGNFLFAGFLVEGPGLSIWDLPMPDPGFEEALHGAEWLDDLAAVGDRAARARAQDWVFDWITRFGRGTGPGWTPDLTGRRLIRWINHAFMLLSGKDRAQAQAFFLTLGQQTLFLARRWKVASPGLPRFEALTGLVVAGIALTGMERHVRPAVAALGRECARQIDALGGIPTRNPEELLEVLTLLIWAQQALEEAGQRPDPAHLEAIARIAPTLRALRHADGGLARFHGGGRGLDGRLDQALAGSGVRQIRAEGLAMGFARLHAGRSSVIADGAAPPTGPASGNAHASTLAFEMTAGRHPLVVNCGSGAAYGREWQRAGRATASHSTLAIRGYSSSRLGPERAFGRGARAYLDAVPHRVWANVEPGATGTHLAMGHDGYQVTHGMTHLRDLTLSADGQMLSGCDTLGAMSAEDRRKFEAVLLADPLRGVPFEIRFHLHPEADAQLDMGGMAVSVALKSGALWLFRHDGVAELSLEPSVYLERGRLRPRASQQIVLRANVLDYACQIGWTFTHAQATPGQGRVSDQTDSVSDL